MNAPPKKAGQTRSTKNAGVLAVRLSADHRQRVEAAAAAAGISVSKYIESCLFRRTLQMYPILATLAQVIAIQHAIASVANPSGVKGSDRPTGVNPETLTDLRSLIRNLCGAARIEIERVA